MAIGACNTKLIFLIRSLIGILHVAAAAVHHILCGRFFMCMFNVYLFLCVSINESVCRQKLSFAFGAGSVEKGKTGVLKKCDRLVVHYKNLLVLSWSTRLFGRQLIGMLVFILTISTAPKKTWTLLFLPKQYIQLDFHSYFDNL